MCRPVEWNDGASSSASRQGYILNCMQERDFCAFSTVRCIDFVEPFGVGCKKFEVIIIKIRSGFVVNVLRTIQFILRNSSIDIFSLTGNLPTLTVFSVSFPLDP